VSQEILERVTYTIADGVATIELARVGGNALDQPMGEALHRAAVALAADVDAGSVRVAVVRAQGKAFSVGGDLNEFATADDRGVQVKATADQLHGALAILRGLTVPVLSVVQGTAAGGGLGFALVGDIVIAAAEAKLVMAYTASGLSPDCGLTWLIPQRLTWPQAMDLALCNRVLTGAEAAQLGLVSRAVPAADLDAEVASVIETLSSGSTAAFSATKRLMAQSQNHTVAEEMDIEAATIAQIIVGPDGVEGVDAFLAKRRPNFQ
jgi:2-(1,2-epoxy-1,2-dihydrophenyl)acetyl-CoA isomerase